MKRTTVLGGVLAVLLWFPAAVLVAILYRFPIPLGGYARGFGELHYVLVGVVFYGLLGGFLIVPAAGALGGWWLERQAAERGDAVRGLVYVTSSIVALLAAVVLAVLEEFIGPW